MRLSNSARPTRAEVLVALLERPGTVAEVAARLRPAGADRRSARAAVRRAVQALRAAGLVEAERIVEPGHVVRWQARRPARNVPWVRSAGRAAVRRLASETRRLLDPSPVDALADVVWAAWPAQGGRGL